MIQTLKQHQKWVLRGLKLLIVAALVWGMWATLARAFADLKKHEYDWQLDPGWLLASGCLYLLGIIPAAIFWQRVMVGAEQNVGLAETIRSFLVSQVGKYLPGKAMVIVLRAGLLRRGRVELTVVTASVFFETLTTMAVGALMGTAILVLTHRGPWELDDINVVAVAAGMFLVTGLPTIPPIFKQLVRALGVGKLNPSAAVKLGQVPYATIVGGWLLVAVGWLLQGLSLWALLRGMGTISGGPFENLPLHAAAVSLAVVAGFLTLIPGGFVGREFVLTHLMAPQYGPAVAAISAILLRLVWLVSECIISIILYFLGPRRVVHAQPAPARGEPVELTRP